MKAQSLIMLLRIASTMARLPRERNRVPKKLRWGAGVLLCLLSAGAWRGGGVAWAGLCAGKRQHMEAFVLCVAFVERFLDECLIVRSASIIPHSNRANDRPPSHLFLRSAGIMRSLALLSCTPSSS